MAYYRDTSVSGAPQLNFYYYMASQCYGDVNRYDFSTTRPMLMDGFVPSPRSSTA